MEQLQTGLTMLEQIIIGAIISVGLAYAIKYTKKGISYLKSKNSMIKDEKLKKIFDSALDSLDHLITTNIVSAENTLKPQILGAIADGKVTKEELKTLSVIVKDNVLKQLGDDTTKALNTNLGDLNNYLENRIEKILDDLKNDENSGVEHTDIPVVKEDINQLKVENAELQAKNASLEEKLSSIQSTIIATIPTNQTTNV
jgi:polyhydroxyalkanoate synthesis regulator phasin